MTKTKTQTKCLRNPTYAISLKSWWLTHFKYDDRYLTLVILFTLVTLVTLFQPYNQFYMAECITVSGFFKLFLAICKTKIKNLLSQRGTCLHWKFLGKIGPVGCNSLFILVLKIEGNSWKTTLCKIQKYTSLKVCRILWRALALHPLN